MSTPSERHETLLRDVSARSAHDADFRARLLVQPHAAIYEAFGIRVPDGVRMRFIVRERTLDLLVVLPDFVDPSGAIDDDALDLAAGGTGDDPHLW